MGNRVAVLGLGDLGMRLAAGLSMLPNVEVLILAGRHSDTGPSSATLLEACGTARVRFVDVDLNKIAQIEKLLRDERPDLIVQCASKLSPWHCTEFNSPAARDLVAAGFAAQLPGQLPLIMNLMIAVRSVNYLGPVVNCSYPDLTHPILERLQLAPLVGIGNVGMIQARVRAALRWTRGREKPGDTSYAPIRVFAHHSQVNSVMLSRCPDNEEDRPWIFLGESGQRADALAYAALPLLLNRRLNALSAAAGLPILSALLPESGPIRTCAPGPLGLAGGYPVVVDTGTVTLDLPAGPSPDSYRQFQDRAARLDGVAEIGSDGTLYYTEAAQEKLLKVHPKLAEPLRPPDAETRLSFILNSL